MKKFSINLGIFFLLCLGIQCSSVPEPSHQKPSTNRVEAVFKISLLRLELIDKIIPTLPTQKVTETLQFAFYKLKNFLETVKDLTSDYRILLNLPNTGDKLKMIDVKFFDYNFAFIDCITKLRRGDLFGLVKFFENQTDLFSILHLLGAMNGTRTFNSKLQPCFLYIFGNLYISQTIKRHIRHDKRGSIHYVNCLHLLADILQKTHQLQFSANKETVFSSLSKEFLIKSKEFLLEIRQDIADYQPIEIFEQKKIENLNNFSRSRWGLLNEYRETVTFDPSDVKPFGFPETHFESTTSFSVSSRPERNVYAVLSRLKSSNIFENSSLEFNNVIEIICDLMIFFEESSYFDGDDTTRNEAINYIADFLSKVLIPFYQNNSSDFLCKLSEIAEMRIIKFVIASLNIHPQSDLDDQSDDRVCQELSQIIDKYSTKEITTLAEWQDTKSCLVSIIKIMSRISSSNPELKFGKERINLKKCITNLSILINNFKFIGNGLYYSPDPSKEIQ
jgi:hypothetical protein